MVVAYCSPLVSMFQTTVFSHISVTGSFKNKLRLEPSRYYYNLRSEICCFEILYTFPFILCCPHPAPDTVLGIEPRVFSLEHTSPQVLIFILKQIFQNVLQCPKLQFAVLVPEPARALALQACTTSFSWFIILLWENSTKIKLRTGRRQHWAPMAEHQISCRNFTEGRAGVTEATTWEHLCLGWQLAFPLGGQCFHPFPLVGYRHPKGTAVLGSYFWMESATQECLEAILP